MSQVCVKTGRFSLVSIAFAVGISVLLGRLYYLQVLNADEVALNAIENRKRLVEIPAKRGEIRDRFGNLLAGTRSMVEIGVDPVSFKEEDRSKLAVLAGILDQPLDEIEKKFDKKTRVSSSGIKRNIRWAKLDKVPENIYNAIVKLQISGVYGNRSYERYYSGGVLASHLIGFVNHEGDPVMGMERAFDFYLKGQKGWQEGFVDGRRRELAAYRERDIQPEAGLSIKTTIDLYIQSVLEEKLSEWVEKYKPEGISAIITNPNTGEILALANYPTFNPNSFNEYPIGNLRNRAVTDVYEPGSTFKIVTVAAALEERKLNADTIIDCSVPVAEYEGRKIRLPSDHHTLGEIPVSKIVSKSSNRGAAQIGILLGEEKMLNWSKKFGFGQSGSWPLEGEISGILHELENWDGLTISRLPTGYAIGATPFQVHQAMSVIASGGVYREPKLLKEVYAETEDVKFRIDGNEEHRVISESTARELAEMLKGVVHPRGTAKRAALPGFEVAGKTGTSRKIINGIYSERHHYASFSGFFPASNPEVVVTIMVDDAKLDGPAYGGVIAAPLFREIGERLISHMAIKQPDPIKPIYVSK